jgi:hypothetical protein
VKFLKPSVECFTFRDQTDILPSKLVFSEFARLLEFHHDKDFVELVLSVISPEGADICCSMPRVAKMCEPRLLPPEALIKVCIDITNGLAEGRLAGPFSVFDPNLPSCVVSPIGAVPKSGSSKLRITHDLKASSVNEFICLDDKSPDYSSVREVQRMVIEAGRFAWMGKFDIRRAYQNVCVDRKGQFFLAFRLENLIFFESRLPFGLNISAYLWDQVTKALKFFLSLRNVKNIGYWVDDFILVENSKESLLKHSLVFQSVCASLGIPLSSEKTVWGQVIVYCGIVFDSVNWVMRLEDSKRAAFLALVIRVLADEEALVSTLESLIGKFIWASQVFAGGGTFSQELLFVLRHFKVRSRTVKLHHYPSVMHDLLFWREALMLPGVFPISVDRNTSPFVVTDASFLGGGGCWNNKWFSCVWQDWDPAYFPGSLHISVLELLAFVVAFATWGHLWCNCEITLWTDNSQVVAVVNRVASKDPSKFDMLRCISWLSCRFGCKVVAKHIAGSLNLDADDLSRGCISAYRSRNPLADAVASAVRWDLIPDFVPMARPKPLPSGGGGLAA